MDRETLGAAALPKATFLFSWLEMDGCIDGRPPSFFYISDIGRGV